MARRCEDCEPGEADFVQTIKYCPYHGRPVYELPEPTCAVCGTIARPLYRGYRFCTQCGAPMAEHD